MWTRSRRDRWGGERAGAGGRWEHKLAHWYELEAGGGGGHDPSPVCLPRHVLFVHIDMTMCSPFTPMCLSPTLSYQVPRTVDIELWDDLVGSCVVGDVLVVTGIVKVLATGDDLGEGEEGGGLGGVQMGEGKRRSAHGVAITDTTWALNLSFLPSPPPRLSPLPGKLGNGSGKKQDLFYMYLEAVSVHHPGGNLRGGGGQEGGGQTASTAVSFSSKDLEFVAKFTQVRGGGGRGRGEVGSGAPKVSFV